MCCSPFPELIRATVQAVARLNLGDWLEENGGSLSDGPVRICERSRGWRRPKMLVGTRIGINVAVELPWRFSVAGNRNVSRPWPAAGRTGSRGPRRRGAAPEMA